MLSLFHRRAPAEALTVETVPSTFPTIEGAEIVADFLGQRLGGDFYDSFRVSSERILFGMLDVAGRRDENQEILARAQEIFRAQGTELFSRADINESDAMTQLCLHLNRGLIESSHGVHSCPAFIGCYHEKFGTLCYTSAGHTPGLLRDASGIADLKATGLPLGLFSHATCEAPTIGMEKGACLLLVSRGVVECRRNLESTEDLDLGGVRRLLQSSPAGGAQAVCDSILHSVADFEAQAPQCDDQTALVFLRKP